MLQAERAVDEATQHQVLNAAPHLRQRPALFPPGEKRPAQGEEVVGHHAEGGVVMETSPRSALEVVQPHLTLHLLIVALHPSAQLGQAHQLLERGVCRERREVVVRRDLLVLGPPRSSHTFSLGGVRWTCRSAVRTRTAANQEDCSPRLP